MATVREEFQALRPPVYQETKVTTNYRAVNWGMLLIVWIVVTILVYIIIAYSGMPWFQQVNANGNVGLDQSKAIGISILIGLLVTLLVWVIRK